ncbi:MAG: hypothetical protein KatS3mg036_0492 [Ignavibacterium sp.]|uniref:hypothetical protein n=1 Tax=Ignavibacterium sp. TaxID=2651167 RepID=UPI0021DE2A95|nr:hypothetical protein [Ignavibacterium sp.]BDQ01938.1 MAG: hypothetical protein KatS3mg037_0513 [Ignavibacterium sp.]GIV45674.1 MAG: hypothetical protein KatS3mg036_0492 [Ignavibacterium sp.]
MQNNNFEKFLARNQAAEALVFYHNKLTDPKYCKTYFPPSPGETQSQYNRRPKISVPITSSIIDRIVNILSSQYVVSVDNQDAQEKLDFLTEKLSLQEFFRDVLVNTLVSGSNLTVLRIGDQTPIAENWDGTYVLLDYIDIGVLGYEYTIQDGIIIPVLDSSIKEEDIRTVLIDDIMFDGLEHNLGFTPAVVFNSVDKFASGKYSKPFPMRFKDLVIEYNHTLSQMSKKTKILQNVWKTNLSVDNPEQPIRLDPDTINFLGPDGVLEQVRSELSLSEEIKLLEILEHHIAKASQVPAEIAGLRDAGKLPSGIALKIIFQPLVEIINRLRPLYYGVIESVAEKLIRMQYLVEGKKSPAQLNITVKGNQNLFPEDSQEQIDRIILLKREGLIDEQTAKLLLEPILNTYLTEKGN